MSENVSSASGGWWPWSWFSGNGTTSSTAQADDRPSSAVGPSTSDYLSVLGQGLGGAFGGGSTVAPPQIPIGDPTNVPVGTGGSSDPETLRRQFARLRPSNQQDSWGGRVASTLEQNFGIGSEPSVTATDHRSTWEKVADWGHGYIQDVAAEFGEVAIARDVGQSMLEIVKTIFEFLRDTFPFLRDMFPDSEATSVVNASDNIAMPNWQPPSSSSVGLNIVTRDPQLEPLDQAVRGWLFQPNARLKEHDRALLDYVQAHVHEVFLSLRSNPRINGMLQTPRTLRDINQLVITLGNRLAERMTADRLLHCRRVLLEKMAATLIPTLQVIREVESARNSGDTYQSLHRKILRRLGPGGLGLLHPTIDVHANLEQQHRNEASYFTEFFHALFLGISYPENEVGNRVGDMASRVTLRCLAAIIAAPSTEERHDGEFPAFSEVVDNIARPRTLIPVLNAAIPPQLNAGWFATLLNVGRAMTSSSKNPRAFLSDSEQEVIYRFADACLKQVCQREDESLSRIVAGGRKTIKKTVNQLLADVLQAQREETTGTGSAEEEGPCLQRIRSDKALEWLRTLEETNSSEPAVLKLGPKPPVGSLAAMAEAAIGLRAGITRLADWSNYYRTALLRNAVLQAVDAAMLELFPEMSQHLPARFTNQEEASSSS